MIKFNKVCKFYDDKLILNNFNLIIKKGDKIRIKGRSGKGKSTIIKMILGFLLPDDGNINFEGKRLCPENLSYIRSKIAYIPQDIYFDLGTCKEVIDNVFSYKLNENIKYTKEELLDLIDLFYLEKSFLNKNISDISGGEKQRLAIIISILLKREVYLLDEITSSLDDKLKEIVVNYFNDIDKTIIVVSHDKEWDKAKMIEIDMELM